MLFILPYCNTKSQYFSKNVCLLRDYTVVGHQLIIPHRNLTAYTLSLILSTTIYLSLVNFWWFSTRFLFNFNF